MPTKLGKGGHGPQEYVPEGNGKASGTYADDSGTNIYGSFKTFKKPEPKKKTIYYRDDWEGIRNYYSKENYEEALQYNIPVNTKEVEYDEDDIRQKITQNIKDLLEKEPELSWDRLYYRKLAMFDKNGNQIIDRDVYEAFLSDDETKNDLLHIYKKEKSEIQQNKIKEEEEAGKKELEKFPKIKGKISVDDNLGSVNKANYDRTGKNYLEHFLDKQAVTEYNRYHKNCQKCAQTFELRMRGYDVIATARPSDYSMGYKELENAGWDMSMYIEPEEGFEYYGNYWFFGSKSKPFDSRKSKGSLNTTSNEAQKNDIIRIVKETGNGARFQCTVAWKYGGAHVFNIINDNGNVRFIDAQSGKTDVSDYFSADSIKPSETMLVRVDKLKLNGNVKLVAKGKGV